MSRVVLTGGGSGGHITPLLAVADELKRQAPDTETIYIGQKGDNLSDIPAHHQSIDAVYAVRAGKWRRYHGEGFKQLLDIRTHLLNIRDAFYVMAGLWQSYRLLHRLKPDVLFVKGGFVGVPVGLAAAWLHIPYVTHDSDALPGLANRIIARWATLHAVALPVEVYSYPPAKTVSTGIPLRAAFKPLTASLRKQYRQALGLPADALVVFIIGGGLGAQRINRAVAEVVPHLIKEFENLYILHAVGRNNDAEMQARYDETLTAAERERVRAIGFIDDVYRYSGAAEVVVTRAGATNLAEFALQAKACVVVPSAFLAGGHQLKNAQYLADKRAAIVLSDDDIVQDPNRLAVQLSDLLRNPKDREVLAKHLSAFGRADASQQLAALLLKTAGKGK